MSESVSRFPWRSESDGFFGAMIYDADGNLVARVERAVDARVIIQAPRMFWLLVGIEAPAMKTWEAERLPMPVTPHHSSLVGFRELKEGSLDGIDFGLQTPEGQVINA